MSVANKLRKLFTKNVVDIAQALVGVKAVGDVVTDNISAAWVEVGEGNIIKVQVTADTYMAFDTKTTGGAVSAATSPAVKLTIGEHYVICSCDYVRASANPSRIELLKV